MYDIIDFKIGTLPSRCSHSQHPNLQLFGHFKQTQNSLKYCQRQKIDYYNRRHRIPILYLRAGIQSLNMSLLQFFLSEQTIIILLLIELIFTIIKNIMLLVKSG